MNHLMDHLKEVIPEMCNVDPKKDEVAILYVGHVPIGTFFASDVEKYKNFLDKVKRTVYNRMRRFPEISPFKVDIKRLAQTYLPSFRALS